MTDTTAKIRAKGCESTGLTESIAVRSGEHLGSHLMAVVELRAVARTDDSEGKHIVQYVITQIEPATTPRADEHLRQLAQSLHAGRKDPDAPPALPGTEAFGAANLGDLIETGESLMVDNAIAGDGPVLTCAFPGCVKADGHDGQHDVFSAPVESSSTEEENDGEDEASRHLATVPDGPADS